jgi:prepilin-type N-terminal cleavage/methylation domain-containing protein
MIKFLKTKEKRKGFTLVEILIATGIFVMVMITLSQVYISIIKTERIAYALLNAENNIRNNLEIIGRSVRMGKNFELTNDNSTLCFDYYLDNEWQTWCYQYDKDSKKLFQIIESETESEQKEIEKSEMLDPSLRLEDFHFYQIKSTNSQVSFIITLKVTTKVKNQEFSFNLQTAITPRFFEIET